MLLYVIGIGMLLTHDWRSAVGTLGLVLLNAVVSAAQEVAVKRQLDKIAVLSRIQGPCGARWTPAMDRFGRHCPSAT